MSSIYFVPVDPTADHEAGIECVIYSDDGRRLASHLMTLDGAAIRMHDMRAAILEGRRQLRKRTNRLSASIRQRRAQEVSI